MSGLGGAGEGVSGVRVMCLCFLKSEVKLEISTPHYVVTEGNVVTVTLESNVDKQMFSWQSDVL